MTQPRRQQVLIVDDKSANLVALERVLSDVDVEVVSALSGNEALTATLDHEFALCILDVQMPTMDGYELAELLKSDEKTRFMPTIFITAEPSGHGEIRGYEVGAVDYVTKPYHPKVLLAKVKVFLELDRQRREFIDQGTTAHERLEDLTGAIVALAALDFDHTARVVGDGGPFDTVAMGLRLLGEELQASTVSNRYVQTLLGAMADALIVLDPDGRIQTANAAASALLGAPECDLIGTELSTLVPEEMREALVRQLRSFRVQDRLQDMQLTLVGRDGRRIPTQANGAAIRTPDGDLSGVVLVARDMRETHRLLAEAAAAAADREKAEELQKAYDELRETQSLLIQASKLTALGELAAGVAHELNQPLNAFKLIVQGMLRCIRLDRYDYSELPADGEELIVLVDKMAAIIDHMRTFTRRPDERPRVWVDVNRAVNDALGLLREQLRLQGIRHETHLSPDLPPVLADPNNLEQVVLNLLTNARDALLAGEDRIDREQPGIVVRTRFLGETEICVEVEDRGGGVPTEFRDRIFDPFFTTKEIGQGTGLGLSIAHRIMLDYGGRLELDVDEGKGSTFRAVLPVAKPRLTIARE